MDATWFDTRASSHIPAVAAAGGGGEFESQLGVETQPHGHGTASRSTSSRLESCMDSFVLYGSDWRVLLGLLVRVCQSYESKGRGRGDLIWIVTTKGIMNESDSGIAGTMGILDRVKIKFVDTLYDVIRLGSALHMLGVQQQGVMPRMILFHGLERIVDSSHGIIPRLQQQQQRGGNMNSVTVEILLCRALAIMADALMFRGDSMTVLGATCLSQGMHEPPRYYYILKRWLQTLYACHPSGDQNAWMVSEIGFDEMNRPERNGIRVVCHVAPDTRAIVETTVVN